jgi:polyisoprenoid-binding protein YceI
MRMRTVVLAVLAGLVMVLPVASLAMPPEATPQESASNPFLYMVDPVHTTIAFAVRHMGVSTVRGRFGDVKGSIIYDPDNIASSGVEVTIQSASISTNNEKRDSDLRSDQFLDVEKFPVITFKSRKVQKSEDGFVAIGDLTIHGVTKEVSIPFTLAGPVKDPWGMMRLGVDAWPIKIDRRDYGLTWNKVIETGGLVVANDIAIELGVEAVRK